MYDKLTKKELAIIQLIAKGFTNEEIAKTLGFSKSTVNVYLWYLRKQHNAKNRIVLVNTLKEKGLL